MKQKKICCILLSALMAGSLIACNSKDTQQKKPALSHEEIASNFAEMWKTEYPTSYDPTMNSKGGNIFLTDVNNDAVPEILLRFDTYKTGTIVVYDISKEPFQKIGELEASALLLEKDGLKIEIYQNQGKRVLVTESVLYGPAANPQNWITEIYASWENDSLQINRLAYTEDSKTGEKIYYKSPYEDTVITQEEYEALQKDYQGKGELAETILLSKENYVEDFQDSQQVKQSIFTLLEQYQG